MPLVLFNENFNWDIPNSREHRTIAYKAGRRARVTQECAEAAIARGRATMLEPEEPPAAEGKTNGGSRKPRQG